MNAHNYAGTAAARAAHRRSIHTRIAAASQHEADRLGRSPKCAHAEHADQPGGCANDGTGCLCECHDPKDTP